MNLLSYSFKLYIDTIFQPDMTMLYRNRLTSFVSIEIGKCQPEMTMLYSNRLTYFVSIDIGECQLEMTMSVFLLSFIFSLLILLNISQLN